MRVNLCSVGICVLDYLNLKCFMKFSCDCGHIGEGYILTFHLCPHFFFEIIKKGNLLPIINSI